MSPIHKLLVLSLLCLGLAACGGGGVSIGAMPEGLGLPPTDTLVVTNHANAGPGSLRQAVEDAPSGAWITFDPALPAGSIPLASPITIEKYLTIGGLSGVGLRHTIDGQGLSQIFRMESGGLQLNDLILTSGLSTLGGAVEVYDTPLICWRVEFRFCGALDGGGAIYTENGEIEVYDCSFTSNGSAGVGGAIWAEEADVRIERTSFHQNQAVQGGGAIGMTGGMATLVNCGLYENSATAPFASGGAIQVYTDATSSEGTLRVFNGTISSNDAGDTAGGIRVDSHGGTPANLELNRAIVALNTAPTDRDLAYGGAAFTSGAYNIVGVGAGKFFNGLQWNQVGDAFSPLDPMLLAPFALPDGKVVSLPLPASPAVDAVPAGLNVNPEGVPIVVDMRLLPRSPLLASDIGAIEL